MGLDARLCFGFASWTGGGSGKVRVSCNKLVFRKSGLLHSPCPVQKNSPQVGPFRAVIDGLGTTTLLASLIRAPACVHLIFNEVSRCFPENVRQEGERRQVLHREDTQ